MLTKSQDDVYFARMAASLGDKESILQFVEPGKILDVGAGGGELSEVLRLAGNEVWALDGSSAAIARISANFPEIHTVEAFSYEVLDIFPENSFDTIVCSSILHEVYSYGDPSNGSYSVSAVLDALLAFYKLLKPGGILIIRDGVMPTDWNEQVTVHLKTSDSVKYFEMYKSQAPFYSDTPGLRTVSFEKVSRNLFKGNLASAMEFLYTLTWGWNSAPRETQELYGIFTENDYCAVLETTGFVVEHSEQYLQPGYPQHLNGVADILNNFGNKHAMPSSNMIITARRPKKRK